MGYSETVPTGPLVPFVRCFWTLTPEPIAPDPGRTYETLRSPWMLVADPQARYTEQLLPDGSVEVAFHLTDPVFACPAGGRPVRLPRNVLFGQLTRPLTLAPAGPAHVVGIRFRPAGASAFLQVRQRALRDRWVMLDEVSHAFRGVPDRLAAQVSWPSRARVLEDVLHGLLVRGLVGRPDPVVYRASDAIERSHGTVRIDGVARQFGVSGRRLLRLFNRHVGLSPKLLARIMRFQRVFRVLQEQPGRSWSELAQETGYYDQAHLVREFRAFAGNTPEAFVRERRDIVEWVETDAA